MRIIKQSIKEAEIQLEVAKVAAKYENLGYKVYYNKRQKGFIFDLYATNNREKIIFEFKHYLKNNGQETALITEKIGVYREKFPDCNIKIVFIRDLPKLNLKTKYLKRVLLSFIEEKYHDEFNEKILSFRTFEWITDIVLTELDFSEHSYIILSGEGNVSFLTNIENQKTNTFIVTDGIPFTFKLRFSQLYPWFLKGIDKENSVIKFDFSEFTNTDSL